MTPATDPLRATRAWLGKAGYPVDNPAMNRIAAFLLNAMASAGGNKADLGLLLTVTLKTQAMLLATLEDKSEEGARIVADYLTVLPDAARAEIASFRAAHGKDVKRQERRRG